MIGILTGNTRGYSSLQPLLHTLCGACGGISEEKKKKPYDKGEHI